MTQIPRPGTETTRLHLVYDAWNRMVAAKNDNGGNPGTTIATYSYDGNGRRIRKAINGGDTFDYYYNANYQLLEVRKNADTDPLEHYVWDISYIDAPLIWFRDSNVDGTVDHTMYVARDANFNVTALIDTSGTVQERYLYDPYGRRTILDWSWGARGSSGYDCALAHQGLMQDTERGLYYNRARMLHSTLGRFVQRDPLGYVDGGSLYEYVSSRPIARSDPSGKFFKYGNYCGAGSPPPLNPPAPPWIDEVDEVCYWHDVCYGAVGAQGLTRPNQKCGVRNCDRRLYNALLAIQMDPAGFTTAQLWAAQQILGFFRGSCNPPSPWEVRCCNPPRVTCNNS
jgi:RHS repeat-associated protein